jgi:DNA-binding phage protein
MSDEINALIETIIATGKEQGLNKGEIALRSGMQNNKFGRIMDSDPRVSTLIRLGHAVGLKLTFVAEDEDLNSIINREVF